MEGKTYKEFQSEMCPDPTPEPSPPPSPPITAIIAGATVGGVFVFVVICAYVLYQKKNSKPSSVVRRTNRSTTLEESDTQAPVAVEPGNTGTLGESTREEENDATIRPAFELMEQNHEENLARRLENVRR